MNILSRLLDPFKSSHQVANMNWQLSERTYIIGHDLTFSIDFIGGIIDQHIENVQVKLICLLDELTGDFEPKEINIINVNIDNNFFIHSNQKLKKFYSINLPKFAPISNNICNYRLELKLNTTTPMQQEFISDIYIGPSEHMNTWFNLLEQLGFTQQAHWNQFNIETQHAFKYQQKFRYRKTQFSGNKSLDLIFWFEQYSDYLDVFVEAFMANQALSDNQEIDAFRFTIDKTDLTSYVGRLLQQLKHSQ